MTTETLNRKETFAAGMVIFISLFYITSLTATMFNNSSHENVKNFWQAGFRMVLLGAVYVTGGVLLFMRKNSGWIIGTATLLNTAAVALVYIVDTARLNAFRTVSLVPIGFFLLLLMALVFLFVNETRKKFRVNNKSYLLAIILYGTLLFITYGF